jgi:hypothetical protein
MHQAEGLKVFVTTGDSTCNEWHERHAARYRVQDRVNHVLAAWRDTPHA